MTTPIRRSLPAVGAGLSLATVYLAVLALPLSIAEELDLSSGETAGWILFLYGISGVLTIGLTWWFRVPLLVTGNVFILLFVQLLGGAYAWAELVGATIAAGLAVLVLALTGLLDKVARWLPAPIVYALLAGTVVAFFVRVFEGFVLDPWLVGGTIGIWVIAKRWLEPAVPAILAALVGGLVLAWATGGLGGDMGFAWTTPVVTLPTFSVGAVLSLSPLIAVLITLQANAPSLVVLRSQEFEPPERTVDLMSGAGTMLGSLFGPMGVSLSLPATALVAGESGGPRETRLVGAHVSGVAALAVALLGAVATDLVDVLPAAYLSTVFGLAIVPVVISAMQEAFGSGMVLGPAFAFGITLSGVEFAGLQSLFWALVVGLVISWLLERDHWPAAAAD